MSLMEPCATASERCTCARQSSLASKNVRSISTPISRPLEQCNAFHMRGVREHVHHPGGLERVTARVDQKPGITRQRRRVTTDVDDPADPLERQLRSEEHTSELQSLMRNSYAVFCLQTKNNTHTHHT